LIFERYLKVRPPQAPAPPPLYVRIQPPPPREQEPMVIREAPPPRPKQIPVSKISFRKLFIEVFSLCLANFTN